MRHCVTKQHLPGMASAPGGSHPPCQGRPPRELEGNRPSLPVLDHFAALVTDCSIAVEREESTAEPGGEAGPSGGSTPV